MSGLSRLCWNHVQHCNSVISLFNLVSLNIALIRALSSAQYGTWWSHAAGTSIVCISELDCNILASNSKGE